MGADDCPDTTASQARLLVLWEDLPCIARYRPAALSAAAEFRPHIVLSIHSLKAN
jgi:hypothetical protein